MSILKEFHRFNQRQNCVLFFKKKQLISLKDKYFIRYKRFKPINSFDLTTIYIQNSTKQNT